MFDLLLSRSRRDTCRIFRSCIIDHVVNTTLVHGVQIPQAILGKILSRHFRRFQSTNNSTTVRPPQNSDMDIVEGGLDKLA